MWFLYMCGKKETEKAFFLNLCSAFLLQSIFHKLSHFYTKQKRDARLKLFKTFHLIPPFMFLIFMFPCISNGKFSSSSQLLTSHNRLVEETFQSFFPSVKFFLCFFFAINLQFQCFTSIAIRWRCTRLEWLNILVGVIRALIYDFVDCRFLITRSRHDVLVVCRNVAAEHRRGFLRLEYARTVRRPPCIKQIIFTRWNEPLSTCRESQR